MREMLVYLFIRIRNSRKKIETGWTERSIGASATGRPGGEGGLKGAAGDTSGGCIDRAALRGFIPTADASFQHPLTVIPTTNANQRSTPLDMRATFNPRPFCAVTLNPFNPSIILRTHRLMCLHAFFDQSLFFSFHNQHVRSILST